MSNKRVHGKIWVTKYSCTTGIEEHIAEISDGAESASVKDGYWNRVFLKKDFSLNKKKAYERAIEMCEKELLAVERRRLKIMKLKKSTKVLLTI